MKKILMTLMVVSLFFMVGFAPQTAEAGEATLNIVGEGSLKTNPNLAKVSIEVSTEGKDKQIQKINAGKTQKVINSLKALGLSDKEIKTINVEYYPLYFWNEDSKKQELKGYKASTHLEVTTEKLDSLGKIIDTAILNGSERILNVEFGLSEKENELMVNKAIVEAVTKAKTQALTTANALGMNIVGIKEVSVNTPNNYYDHFVARDFALKEAANMSDEVTQINPNELEVEASVSIVYLIK